jgi:hypothetical protein
MSISRDTPNSVFGHGPAPVAVRWGERPLEKFGFVLALLGIVLTFVVGWIVTVRWYRRWHALLHRVARQLGGTVPDSDTFDLTFVHFTIEGRSARIEFERGEGFFTRVKVSLPRRSPGVFRLLRQEDANWEALFVRTKDIKIGNARFDAAWFVTSRPESLAHRIFAEDRRPEVISSARLIEGYRKPSIEITRDSLTVKVDQLLTREADILAIAGCATAFVGYLLRLGPEEGIAWLGAGGEDPGLCPVCAAELADGVVQCDKCRTPHHRECWTYVGQCSTYACKGKKWQA